MREGPLSKLRGIDGSDGPLVSVVVPVYNTPEQPLRRCVGSLLAQEYINIEIILVDDGSDAPCLAVLGELADLDPRVRVISARHVGVSHARNVGIDAATGEWLAFSDADDEVETNFVGEAVRVATAEHVDLVFGGVEPLYRGDNPTTDPGSGSYCVIDEPCELGPARMQMLGNVRFESCGGPDFKGRGPVAKLYRRSTIGDLRFDEKIAIGEDTLFNYRAMERCHSLAIVDRTWYRYYQYRGSAVHTNGYSPWQTSIEGLMSACGHGEEKAAFVTRCAFMTTQAVESFISSDGALRARGRGIALLRYTGEQGCFAAECCKGYRVSAWLRMFIALCRHRMYGLAYWYWALKTSAKSARSNKTLIYRTDDPLETE